jgi:hypothetical protein
MCLYRVNELFKDVFATIATFAYNYIFLLAV